jgi:tetratricopeptide (TPR) repeat protein
MLAAYQRAQASSEQGDLATTKQLFEQTQKLAPQHEIVAELRRIVAESLATQALDQIARNQLFDKEDSAYITYRQLLKLSPNPATGETIRERLLAALKERAEEQIKRKRYTTPKDNNAFDSYRLMLRIMPKNAAAQAGLKVLADKYAWLTKRELDRGRNKRALEFVKRGLDIQPRDKTLLAYQETILGYQEKPFESMLQRAKQHISAGRLMFPPGNNAYDIYQQVLQNDPEQAEAHQGLQEIADIYAQKAKVARAKGQLTESRTHIEAGLQVLPGHQELLKIRQELDSLSE